MRRSAIQHGEVAESLEPLVRRVRAYQQLPEPAERKALREAAGLSLAELGGFLGVTGQCVWNYEEGRRQPRGELAERYVEALSTLREAA